MFNAKRGIFKLYHGENKLHFNYNNVHFVLHQHAKFDSNSTSSLKQQSTCHSNQSHYPDSEPISTSPKSTYHNDTAQ